MIRASYGAENPRFTAGGTTGQVRQLDWDGNETWLYVLNDDQQALHHDVEVLPNGNVLMLVWEYRSDAEAIQAGRDPNNLAGDGLWPELVIEVEPTGPTTGDIVWEWDAWDHMVQDIDPTKDNYGVVADHPELIDINYGEPMTNPEDWLHANAVDYNPDLDQIMISIRQYSEFWVIDHSTTTAEAAGHTGGNSGMGGDLLYRWGNPEAYGRGDAGDRQLYNQHDSQWITPGLAGEGNILVFDNGTSRPGELYSTVQEIVPPVDAFGVYDALAPGEPHGPAAPTWSYQADPPELFYSGFISGVQRLPNGNTLICSGVFGIIFEVTPAGDIVWSYINPVTNLGPLAQGEVPQGLVSLVFRAERYATDYPAFDGKTLVSGDPLELDTDGDILSDEAENVIFGSDPGVADTDQDGCLDGAEIYGEAFQGGGRDPTSFWDLFDVWTPPLDGTPGWERDNFVTITDVLGVAVRFGPGTAPAPEDAVAEALTPPAPGNETGYHPAFDRGPTVGEDDWDRGPPDGNINVTDDILGIAAQFGHRCL